MANDKIKKFWSWSLVIFSLALVLMFIGQIYFLLSVNADLAHSPATVNLQSDRTQTSQTQIKKILIELQNR